KTEEEIRFVGKKLLIEKDPIVNELEVLATGFENSHRKVILAKVLSCYHIFRDLLNYYAVIELVGLHEKSGLDAVNDFLTSFDADEEACGWSNIGGQLITQAACTEFVHDIHEGRIGDWQMVHEFYSIQAADYPMQKLTHAFCILHRFSSHDCKNADSLKTLLEKALETRNWISDGIFESRAKDYSNPFRRMMYSSEEEMNAVLGSLQDNGFIEEEERAHKKFTQSVKVLMEALI
ncbi:MAG: hypothetical protein ABI151_14915, partial [Chitinophagaceae bacterium]